MFVTDQTAADLPLASHRVATAGTLASMSRRELARVVSQHGGQLVAAADEATLVIVGEDADEPPAATGELLHEADFFARIGLVERPAGVQRLYTPAMLADLLRVPLPAVRRWQRRGYLHPQLLVGRLAYFDLTEVQVARKLASLLAEGCSLSRIDRCVADLEAAVPEVDRPLVELSLVVQEGRLLIRQDEDLSEPGGQRLFDFDVAIDEEEDSSVEAGAVVPFPLAATVGVETDETFSADEARMIAHEAYEQGDLTAAIEACRAVLLSGEGSAEDQFLLADLLYRSGDLVAARERYYTAVEQDESYLEARVNLGCVLVELKEHSLAIAAFTGALSQQPYLADAHFHLAKLLDELGREAEAIEHWQAFTEVAPEGVWLDQAWRRLEQLPVDEG